MMSSFFNSSLRSARTIAAAGSAVMIFAACASSSDSLVAPSAGAATHLDVSTNGLALDGIGATDSVSATARDAEGNATNAAVTWTTDDANIAQVSANGASAAITGKSAGITHIHATSAGFTADVEIRVLGVKSLALEQSTVAIRVGDAQQISANVDADPSAKRGLTYASSNAAVATVNADGLVSGLAAGTASITVTSVADPRISASAKVTVNPARGVSFAPGLSAITLWLGDTRTLTADADVDAAESHGILWTSENTAVAMVSDNGELTAVGPGTAIIRAVSAADPRAQAQLVLTVLPARTVTVTPDASSLSVGARQQFAAMVVIESGLSTDVVWTTSDANVATVSKGGLVTAISAGSARITATSVVDGERSGSATVTVTDAVAGGERRSR